MATVSLTRPPKDKTPAKRQGYPKPLPHLPNYLTIHPPGDEVRDKIEEMGINAAELATQMGVSPETVEKLIKWEIPLTHPLAKKVELATGISADFLMRLEAGALREWAFAVEHYEIPAYWNGEVINQMFDLT